MTKCGWMAVASRQFDSSTPKFSSIISERSQPGVKATAVHPWGSSSWASLQGVLPHWHVPLEEALRPPHVVDQHVQTALLVLDTPHESPHLLRFEMVDSNGAATTARPIDEFGRLLDRLGTVVLRAPIACGAASDVYRGPGRAELDRDPPPGSTRTSGHPGHSPFQLRRHTGLLPITSRAYKVHPDQVEHCNVLPPKEPLGDPVRQRQ